MSAVEKPNNVIPPLKKRRMTARERLVDSYTCDILDDKICAIVFENPIASLSHIAALVGTTKQTVEKRLKKPAVRKKLDEMRITVDQLIQRGQVLGMRMLMQLCVGSKDEFIKLQAAKLLTAPALAVQRVSFEGKQRMIYEIQVGPQGQVFQTVKPLVDPSANPNKFDTADDLAARLIAAESIDAEVTDKTSEQ